MDATWEGVMDDDTAIGRREAFALHRELLVSSLQRQFDYGKWVLASLLAAHLGGLFLLSQADDKRGHLFEFAGPWLIFGAGAALLSGALAWVNFSVVAYVYSRVVISHLGGTTYKPTRTTRFATTGTLVVSPTVAAASLVMFLVAAFKALSVL
jgi:hypothetical protein